MPEARSDLSESSPDRELVICRVIDAPRHLVFAAWTSREHLPRWYGPDGFTTTIEAMDVRAGGAIHIVMRGPDGTRYRNAMVYDEVRPPERLAYTTRGGADGEPEIQFKTIVSFEAQGARTKLTLRHVFPTAAAKADNIARYHSDVGATQTLDRLEATMNDLVVRGRELRLERTFAAPRALVWDAFTKPEHAKQWLAPRPLTMPVLEIHDDIEVETVVTFADAGSGTRVTVHQTYSGIGDPTMGAKMGWTTSLDTLAEILPQLR